METCQLFVYGLLKPGFRPPRSMVFSREDAIRGKLYDLGPHPAATEIKDSTGSESEAEEWIAGFTLTIDEGELSELDEFEDVAGGQYRRLMVRTQAGCLAWVYEYAMPITSRLKRVTFWPPK